MKKSIFSLLLVLGASVSAWGGQSYDPKTWLSQIPDDEYVANLSLPGAHDAMSKELGSFYLSSSQTQNYKYTELWDKGVRVFDFRPSLTGTSGTLKNNLMCCHGAATSNLYMHTVFNFFRDKLNNSKEFAVFHVLKAKGLGHSSNYDKYVQALTELMADYPDLFVEYRRDLKVEDMRGKILMLYRDWYTDAYKPTGGFMEWWSETGWSSMSDGRIVSSNAEQSRGSLYTQDLAETGSNDLRNEKKNMARYLLDFTTTHYTRDDKNLVWTFNFLSAYDGSSSSSTNYAKNAAMMHEDVLNYMNTSTYVPGPMGMVMMDWVGCATAQSQTTRGDEMLAAVIENNFKYITPVQKSSFPVSFLPRDNYFTSTYVSRMGKSGKAASPLVADYDNDGYMDVYASGETYSWNAEKSEGAGWDWMEESTISYFTGLGSGSTMYSPNYDVRTNAPDGYLNTLIPAIYGGLGSTALDFNQDGRTDMLLWDKMSSGWGKPHHNTGGIGLRLIRNNTGTEFEDVTSSCDFRDYRFYEQGSPMDFTVKSVVPNSIAVSDMNMDGYPDILFTGGEVWSPSWERFTKLYLYNPSTGKYVENSGEIRGANDASVGLGDLNNDGYPDAVVSGYSQEAGWCFDIYKNDGKGNLTLVNEVAPGVGISGWLTAREFHLLDSNQDGLLDIIVRDGGTAYVLLNASTDGNFAFTEVWGNYQYKGDVRIVSLLADFNGDGFVDYVGKEDGASNAYISYSNGSIDSYSTNDLMVPIEDYWMGMGDVDNDGMVDFISANKDNGDNCYFYRNTSLYSGATGNVEIAVPGAPTNIKSSYDPAKKRLTLTWDKMTSYTGAKAIYNTYIVKDGRTFMRCPANKATGRQAAYTKFASYVQNETCFYEGIEPGVYEFGVQSVAYSYNASGFSTIKVAILDENEAVNISESGDMDVVMFRTLKAGKWNTVCLPFSMTAGQIAAAGLGIVKQFTGVTAKGTGFYSLGFEDVTAMTAGVPYLVKPTADVDMIKVERGAMVAGMPEEVTKDEVTFVGTFETKTLNGLNKYFISNNQFYRADQNVTVKGYRAYFELPTGAEVNRLFIDGLDETDVDAIEADAEKPVDVYTVGGAKVRSGVPVARALDGLQRGIYVVNGKTVVK